MRKKIIAICKISIFAVLVAPAIGCNTGTPPVAQEPSAPVKKSPAEGYNVHVLAPHLVDGKQMGPYHHYCKVIAPEIRKSSA